MPITLNGDGSISGLTATGISAVQNVPATSVITTLNAPSGVLATQNGMTGICKAWAVYNANASSLINSFNVSSITFVSSGIQTINFTTAMPNINYTVSGSASLRDTFTDGNLGTVAYGRNSSSSLSTTACTVNTAYANPSTLSNFPLTCVVFHGN
jgi:hypothetical protein